MTTIIRTSDRNYFKRCRQLWDFTSKIRQNYEPEIVAKPLNFGTAIHAALEAFYDPQAFKNMGYESRVGIGLGSFLKTIKEQKATHLRIRGAEDLAFEIEDDYEQQSALGIGMLQNYFSWARTNDNFIPVYVEIEFEVPIEGLDATYQGRIDLIVQDEFGYYWIVDHKTTSQFGDVEYLALDEQCGSYVWAIKKAIGIDIKGIIYNEIRKAVPEGPKVLKKGTLSVDKGANTTYELFLQACKNLDQPTEMYADYLDYLKNNGKQFIRRTKVLKNSNELEVQERRIYLEAVDMINNPSIYPNASRFNCMGCSFMQPCIAKQENNIEGMQFMLDNLFRKRA